MTKRYGILLILATAIILLNGCGNKEGAKRAADENKPQPEIEDQQERVLVEVKDPLYIAEGIRKLSVKTAGEEVLQISYEPKEYESSYEYWKIRIPYGEEAIVDTEAVLELYHYLERLDFTPAIDVPDSTTTGLDSPDTSITVDFCQTNQEERAAVMAGNIYEGDSPSYQADADSSCTLMIGKKNAEGFYYGKLSANPTEICLIPAAVIEPILNVDPFTLILKVSAAVSIDTVEEIRLTMEGREYQLTPDHKLYGELFSILLVSEIEEPDKVGDEILLKLHFVRNIESEQDLDIEYHSYDETYGSVSVNGTEKFLVKLADIERLKEMIKKQQ